MDIEAWRARAEGIVAGRRWLVAGERGFPAELVDRFRRLGATGVAVAHPGGERHLDAPSSDVPEIVLDAPPTEGGDLMAGIRRFEASLRRAGQLASPEDLAALEQWDPEREAVAYVGYLAVDEVLGRRVVGARPTAQARLEDKVRVVDVFRRAGLPMPPHRIVPARPDTLREAHRQLAGPSGAVWAIDDRDGWHGGGVGTRLVSDRRIDEAVTWAVGHADRVRVMPFLDGIPMSIHGVVFDAGVAVFRPVELLTLVDPERGRFVYASVATTFDPSPDDRAAMRAMARRLGHRLARHHGYRGAFNVDGVLTATGFLPTELNPRFSIGAGIQTSAAGIPIDLLDIGIREGAFADVTAFDIEQLGSAVVDAADAIRRVRMLVATAQGPSAVGSTTIRIDPTGRIDDLGPEPGPTRDRRGLVLDVAVHPAGTGAHVVVSGTTEPSAVGARPFGPSSEAIVRWADRRYGLGIGDVRSAASLRHAVHGDRRDAHG